MDAVTWARLLEAGWHLGQRLLYLTRPNLRGDDVAELQVRLAQLGFNPGRIDGIFGPISEHALADFQRNCGVEANGTLTRSTLHELTRMAPVITNLSLVTDARDVAGFDESPAGPIVLTGSSPLVAIIEKDLSPSFDVASMGDVSTEAVAHFANSRRASLVLSIERRDEISGLHLHYWASYRSHSRRGQQLASEIAAELSTSEHLPRVEVTGMALPILRETSMTTLRIEHPETSEDALAETSSSILRVVGRVFHR